MATPSAAVAAVVTGLLLALTVPVCAAPPAGAGPDCADLAPHTRLCRTPGHVGITTSPDPALTNRPPGWGYGGAGGGFGGGFWGLSGGGVWIAF